MPNAKTSVACDNCFVLNTSGASQRIFNNFCGFTSLILEMIFSNVKIVEKRFLKRKGRVPGLLLSDIGLAKATQVVFAAMVGWIADDLRIRNHCFPHKYAPCSNVAMK